MLMRLLLLMGGMVMLRSQLNRGAVFPWSVIWLIPE
jgi:hypothetical protein